MYFPSAGGPCDLRSCFLVRKFFYPLALKLLRFVFASSFVLGEGLVFQKKTAPHPRTQHVVASRTPSPCAYVHVRSRCFRHRLSPAYAFLTEYSDFDAVIQILRPQPLPFPPPEEPVCCGGVLIDIFPASMGNVISRGHSICHLARFRGFTGSLALLAPAAPRKNSLLPQLPPHASPFRVVPDIQGKLPFVSPCYIASRRGVVTRDTSPGLVLCSYAPCVTLCVKLSEASTLT